MTRQYNEIQLEILVDRVEQLIGRCAYLPDGVKVQKMEEFNAAVEAAATMDEKLSVIDLWSLWFA